jgi:hypothetical protein
MAPNGQQEPAIAASNNRRLSGCMSDSVCQTFPTSGTGWEPAYSSGAPSSPRTTACRRAVATDWLKVDPLEGGIVAAA